MVHQLQRRIGNVTAVTYGAAREEMAAARRFAEDRAVMLLVGRDPEVRAVRAALRRVRGGGVAAQA